MSKSGTLFTIGYEGRTQDEYLARLREHGVTVLCDVRRNAISRKKGFAKKALSEGCKAHGIRYEHLPELGVDSDRRKGLTTAAEVEALFAEYTRDWLPKQSAAITKLCEWLAAGEKVALTCFEREPERCHRHCISEALESQHSTAVARHL